MSPAALTLALQVIAAAPAASGTAEAGPLLRHDLRHDLRVGDHLTFTQTLRRRIRSARHESTIALEWQTHLLVVAAEAGVMRVGMQRNRTGAQLERHRESGRDRTLEARRELEESLRRRGARFAETNWVRHDGVALLPWQAVREWTSERLPLFHEIEPLPPGPVAAGERFVSPGLLSLPMRVAGSEPILGEECLRLEGEMAGGDLRVRQWHGVASGLPGRLEFDARYEISGGARVEESFRSERRTLTRGQSTEQWLAEPATALAVLSAAGVLDRLPVPVQGLERAAGSPDPLEQRLALAAVFRHRQRLPPGVLRPLLAAAHPRVRTLAVRVAAAQADAELAELVARARDDGNPFVRVAASPRPPADPVLRELADRVRDAGPLPSWPPSISLRAGLGRELLLSRKARAQIPGTTLRFMRDAGHRGRPYVLHVPEDYRGDEPFPLVIILGGGWGRALPTAQTAAAELDARGFLAAFPQAEGMWWDPPSGVALEALLAEVLAELNVDTDRVSITGLSNGGTGTVLFAARLPDRFAAYVSLMGGGLPVLEQQSRIDPLALGHLPGLFVHGTRDDVIPHTISQQTVEALRRARADAPVELRLLPDRPHDVRYGNDAGLTFPHLERFTRDPFPRAVQLRSSDLAHARAFWVEVLDKARGTAEVDGRIDGQRITLRTRGVRRVALRLRRELLDLDRPVEVQLDGRRVFEGSLREDPALFLQSWRETGDPQLAAAARIVLGP